MGLVALDANVECLLVEQDPDVRALGRLATLERLALSQRPNGRRSFPIGFIKAPVDVNRSCGPLGRRNRRVTARTVWLLCGEE